MDQEQTRLVDSPDQTSREITRDLLKWFADQLTQRNQPDEALAVMRKMTSLLNSTPQEVLDAVDWFRERRSWAIVVEIASQFPETFKRSPLLLYRLAETYSQLGDRQKAEETAQQALGTTPDEPEKHLEMAGCCSMMDCLNRRSWNTATWPKRWRVNRWRPSARNSTCRKCSTNCTRIRRPAMC